MKAGSLVPLYFSDVLLRLLSPPRSCPPFKCLLVAILSDILSGWCNYSHSNISPAHFYSYYIVVCYCDYYRDAYLCYHFILTRIIVPMGSWNWPSYTAWFTLLNLSAISPGCEARN